VPRVLVTGAAGLLGSYVVQRAPGGAEVVPATRATCELSDADAVDTLFKEAAPDVVVHTAYGLADLQRDVVAASGNVIEACRRTGAELVHISSDVVFDGESAPYAEHDPTSPVHAYGEAKAAVEERLRADLPSAAVLRTSLVCSIAPLDPRSAWIVEGLRSGRPPVLYTDEVRCPVRADDLADAIWELVDLPAAERGGPWHLVGDEALTRHQLGAVLATWDGHPPSSLPAEESGGVGPDGRRRPRDLRLVTDRADEALRTRLRSVRTLFRRR
jgi:dTDP-4-dehydrorhamnose reductase